MVSDNLLNNIHPGEILLEEFVQALGISQYQLGKETGIPHSTITRIVQARQSITPDIAIKLAAYFGTSEKFWLGLQADYDIEAIKRQKNFLPSKNQKNIVRKKGIKNKKLIAS